jgi:hypothetical protein
MTKAHSQNPPSRLCPRQQSCRRQNGFSSAADPSYGAYYGCSHANFAPRQRCCQGGEMGRRNTWRHNAPSAQQWSSTLRRDPDSAPPGQGPRAAINFAEIHRFPGFPAAEEQSQTQDKRIHTISISGNGNIIFPPLDKKSASLWTIFSLKCHGSTRK